VSPPTHEPVVLKKVLSIVTRKGNVKGEKKRGNEGRYRRGKINEKKKFGK
jgi:hypothetical protein